MFKDLDVIKVSIDEIKPYEKNTKKHPREQIEDIATSIREYGFSPAFGSR